MTYLICPICHHPNELRTPYLTFCSRCSKKMGNNFSEWSREHPGHSFEDYKHIVGKTGFFHWEREHTTAPKRTRKTFRGWITVLSVAALSLAVLTTLLLFPESSAEGNHWPSVSWPDKETELSSWPVITVPEDNFEVRMPSEPVVEQSVEKSELGDLEYTQYTVSRDNTRKEPYLYTIGILQYPGEVVNSRMFSTAQSRDFLDYSLKQLLRKSNWQILHQKEITYGLYPGKEVVLSDAPSHSESRLRLYLMENTLYSMQVCLQGRVGSERAAEKFLNSFKLLSYVDSGR